MGCNVLEAKDNNIEILLGKRFFTIAEVANIIRVSNKLIYKIIEEGKITFYQFGNRKVILEQDLEQYITSCCVVKGK